MNYEHARNGTPSPRTQDMSKKNTRHEQKDQARDNRRNETPTHREMKPQTHSPSKANHEASIHIEAAQLAASIGRDRRIIGHIDPDMHMRCATEVPNE